MACGRCPVSARFLRHFTAMPPDTLNMFISEWALLARGLVFALPMIALPPGWMIKHIYVQFMMSVPR
ncbi:hypothetical protein ARMGADRAFT_100696 [Armillaria gallica]|uniref:Uncharacterized protein n=1 Tax=Armillaria gallica TaxID=47427 RepID=A0A2H3CSW0_ARMGA|nr:hypothetical protein ARMGADRAFT_100696 [Armillaria gallica]